MAPSINAFGQNFSSPFGGSSSIFGLSSSSFNNSGNTMSFTSSSGASSFGGNLAGFGEPGASNQRKGSQPAPYVTTAVEEDITRQLVSISAMLVYEDKSHEELRWDYYQNQNKGSTQTSTVLSGSSAPTAFGSHSNYGGTVSMPFGSTTSFGTTTNGSSIGQNSSGLFGTASMSSCSPFMSSSRTRTFLPFSTPSFVGTATPFSGFGEPGASNQRKGSQPAPYVTTAVKEDITRQLVSISAMRVYEDKSHEELRWDYYQNQNKGQNL